MGPEKKTPKYPKISQKEGKSASAIGAMDLFTYPPGEGGAQGLFTGPAQPAGLDWGLPPVGGGAGPSQGWLLAGLIGLFHDLKFFFSEADFFQ